MRLTLPNQLQIDQVSKPLGDSLRAMKANLGAWGDKEHLADGKHGDVTATALEVANTAVFGKINLRSVTYTEPGGTGGTVHNLAVADLRDVSCLRIIPESSPLQITGIDATGRQRGDLLLLLNCDYDLDPADIQLLGENTNSVATNRFVDTTASASGAAGTVTIQGARGVWLIYDDQEREVSSNPLGGRWRILDPTF
jgi:hypothetical protein